jgi:hypothetical protein
MTVNCFLSWKMPVELKDDLKKKSVHGDIFGYSSKTALITPS